MSDEGRAAATERADVRGALLLAAAAIVTAALGARAAMLSDQAQDAWHTSRQNELAHSQAILNDVSTIYGDEAIRGLVVSEDFIQQDSYAAEADRAKGELRSDMLVLNNTAALRKWFEARSVNGLTDPETTIYRRKYGWDVAARLVDYMRNTRALAHDPVPAQRNGDRLSRRSTFELVAAIPAAFAFLVGTLGHAAVRLRRVLFAAAAALLAAAIVTAIVLEVIG